jgi:peptidoglycan/LPS O-acetylase OafA/YrhL
MVVALSHICPVLFPNITLPFPGGHAVVGFFVISGFVIAYSVDRKDQTFDVYLVNRLSRLWCVVVPALILGVLIIPIVGGNQVAEAAPPPADWSSAGIHSILNLFFVSQFWALKEPPPFNTPFWSLSYEAAYYTVFAA